MQSMTLDTVVVGAGQAGLGTSYFLQRNRRNHIVLERGRIGETWLSQRWDSFQLNSPNSISTLPGLPYEGPEPDGFWRRDPGGHPNSSTCGHPKFPHLSTCSRG
jgi:putative flavoprotein involved in K+ transport